MSSSKQPSNKLVGAVGDEDPPLDGSGLSQLMEEMDTLQKRHQSEMRLLLETTGRRMLDGVRVHSRQQLSAMDENSETIKQEYDSLSQDHCSPLGNLTANGQSHNCLDSNRVWKRQNRSKDSASNSSASLRSKMPSLRGDRTLKSINSSASLRSKMSGDRTLKSIIQKKTTRPNMVDECVFETSRDRLLERQTKLQKITKSHHYEWFSGLLICLNAIFIGYQTEFLAQRVENSRDGNVFKVDIDPPHIILGSGMFTILFCIELGLRWISDGLFGFFASADLSWHVFDVFIVAFSVVDSTIDVVTWAQSVSTSGSTNLLSSISVLRVLRIVRVVKLARVIRLMSFFRELRLMIFSILGCMKSLVWVTLILGMCIYIFSISITSGTAEYVAKNKLWEEPSQLRKDFGTLSRSVLSLYMAMAGGRSWGEYYEEMVVLPLQYPLLFVIFITFTIFAVLNIVTGVFVDSAFQANTKSRQVIIHEELQLKREYLRELKNLFSEMDMNGDGCLSVLEFEERLCDERVIAFFKAMKLDVTDSKTLFKILDKDGSDQVDITEFLEGCYNLQGESRSIDTKILRLQLSGITEVVWRLENQQQTLLEELQSDNALSL